MSFNATGATEFLKNGETLEAINIYKNGKLLVKKRNHRVRQISIHARPITEQTAKRL